MSTDRDVTRIVRSWLEDGATALPDRVLDNVLDQLPATPQRRAWWPARRFRDMNTPIQARDRGCGRGRRGDRRDQPACPVRGGRRWPGPDTDALADRHRLSPSPSPSPSPARDPRRPAGGRYVYDPAVRGGTGGLCAGQAGCIEARRRTTRSASPSRSRMAGLGSRAASFAVEIYAPPGGHGLALRARRLVVQRPMPCRRHRPTSRRARPSTSSSTALADHPDLDVTTPVDVTLAGYSGKYLELRAAGGHITDDCDDRADATSVRWEPGHLRSGAEPTDGASGSSTSRAPGSWSGVMDYAGRPPRGLRPKLQAIVDSIQIEP